MGKNIKHSKIKNTGVLFELLVRQITTDTLNGTEYSSALKIVKVLDSLSIQLRYKEKLLKALPSKNLRKLQEQDQMRLQ